MKREVYGENKDINIEKNIFVICVLFLKQSKNVMKPRATNY